MKRERREWCTKFKSNLKTHIIYFTFYIYTLKLDPLIKQSLQKWLSNSFFFFKFFLFHFQILAHILREALRTKLTFHFFIRPTVFWCFYKSLKLPSVLIFCFFIFFIDFILFLFFNRFAVFLTPLLWRVRRLNPSFFVSVRSEFFYHLLNSLYVSPNPKSVTLLSIWFTNWRHGTYSRWLFHQNYKISSYLPILIKSSAYLGHSIGLICTWCI